MELIFNARQKQHLDVTTECDLVVVILFIVILFVVVIGLLVVIVVIFVAAVSFRITFTSVCFVVAFYY
jgi:hypothetical protein